MTMQEINAVLESMTRLFQILMEKVSTSKIISDNEIVSCKELLTKWEVGIDVEESHCYVYEVDGKVYRVNEGQGHKTQENWTPDKTPAMYTVINVAHAGTKEDPIPASKGIEYTYGLYYLDPEDEKIYICEREGEEEGGKITLQFLPHELIDQYFKLAE